MSGSTTPVSSANSYSDADVRAQSVWQAEVNKLKVAQLDELLSSKGVKPRCVKAEEAMEVAWRYTKEEITEWRATQETLTPPALLSTPRPSQPTLDTYFQAKEGAAQVLAQAYMAVWKKAPLSLSYVIIILRCSNQVAHRLEPH